VLQARQAPQVAEACIGHTPGTGQLQAGDGIEIGDPRKRRVRHLARCVERGQPVCRHDRDDVVPVALVAAAAHFEAPGRHFD
jgi:hypothetical protein